MVLAYTAIRFGKVYTPQKTKTMLPHVCVLFLHHQLVRSGDAHLCLAHVCLPYVFYHNVLVAIKCMYKTPFAVCLFLSPLNIK